VGAPAFAWTPAGFVKEDLEAGACPCGKAHQQA